MNLQSFYRGKRVLVTGHTGFKGTWLCKVLALAGADVTGYALPHVEGENLFCLSGVEQEISSVYGDIRDFDHLQRTFQKVKPEIVFHLAAQPIVLESYRDPVRTYGTNVMGTVNLLECVRQSDSVLSVVNVTTDKVYDNKEWCWGYRETDALDGQDPYANSKSCSELVTHSYIRSFFAERKLPVSTMRAGNVIGGGDFAPNRIIPDCVRAAIAGNTITVRNPYSIRPYQHVLEPLMAYLQIAMQQSQDYCIAGAYNVGPEERDCITTGELVELFCKAWGDELSWTHQGAKSMPHEANFLRLDSSKLRSTIGWHPVWDVKRAVEETVMWSKDWWHKKDIKGLMKHQIFEYTGQAYCNTCGKSD